MLQFTNGETTCWIYDCFNTLGAALFGGLGMRALNSAPGFGKLPYGDCETPLKNLASPSRGAEV